MILGGPKATITSLWSPQIPLVPLPWEPWDLILRTGVEALEPISLDVCGQLFVPLRLPLQRRRHVGRCVVFGCLFLVTPPVAKLEILLATPRL